MYCNKCGNELKEDDLFCNKCGNKVEVNEDVKNQESVDKKINKKNTKLITKMSILLSILIGVILIGALIGRVNNSLNKDINNTSNQKEKVIETYELNKVSLWKGKNILDEEYNENNDLISYTYLDNDNKKQKIKFDYKYDDLKRVRKISTETGIYVTINYAGEEKKISSIDNYFSNLLMRYTFIYYDNELPKILKSSNFNSRNGELSFEGCILFEEKQLDGKKYILTIETNKNGEILSEKINLKENIKSENIFDILETAPIEYWEGETFDTEGNIKSIILDNIISLDFEKIVSHGKEIYSKKNENVTKNIYDNNNRVLSREDNLNNLKYFYKYTDISSSEYDYSCFLYTENNDAFRASNWTEEEIEKYGGIEQKFRVCKNENGNVIRVEKLSDEEKIGRKEINKKLQEYEEYVSNNKVDTSSLNFDDLRGQLEKMKNSGGIENSITYNPLIDNKSEDLKINSSSTDSQTSNDSTTFDGYNKEELSSNEDIKVQSTDYEEQMAKQELDNASVNLYIEYTKNGEGYYRSNYYDLSSDIQQINELASESEFIKFNLNCHYKNFTVTIKETGETYNKESVPYLIPFIEGNNTIIVELKDQYGHSKIISNTINVKKVGEIN